MAITNREAREQILEDLALAIEQLTIATTRLGEVYELLAVDAADRLEANLFRPAQKAFGRAKRTHAQFAERTGLAARGFDTPMLGRPSQGVKVFIEQSVAAAFEADRILADLQDSMLPIESGDAELRAGLSEVRDLLDGLSNAAREFIRTLGR